MNTSAMKRSQERHFECAVFTYAGGAELEAARRIKDFVSSTPQPVLGLATGRTMLPVYGWLRNWYAAGEVSFAHCSSFNLDEYCGLAADDPSSFAAYMRSNLFDHIDVPSARWHLPDASTIGDTPQNYDALIRADGGIGLQLLGIGRNGHIGFNEPGTEGCSLTHKVQLTPSTRAANAADFPDAAAVPTHAITMGIATILEAETIVLLATGAGKADALLRAFKGPIDKECPASYLQLHNHVTVICDAAAAALLREHA